MSELFEQVQQEYQGFQITDDSSAEWAVRKIKEAQSDTAKWQEHFATQLSSIKKANDATVDYMTTLLARYFESVPHKKTDTQEKYTLPSAVLVRKRQAPDFQRDSAKLLAYLDKQQMTDFIGVVRSPKWDALKPLTTVVGESVVMLETGETVDGVTAVARPDKFDVQIKGE